MDKRDVAKLALRVAIGAMLLAVISVPAVAAGEDQRENARILREQEREMDRLSDEREAAARSRERAIQRRARQSAEELRQRSEPLTGPARRR